MGEFSGTTTWITGGGAGIGRATALRFAEEGARVGISTLIEADAEEVRNGCRDRGAQCVATVTDMSDAAQVAVAHRAIVEEFGPVAVLVNNVGVNQPATDFLDTSDEVFLDIYTVNFLSYVRATRLVLPDMLASGTGAIVSVASAQGLLGWPQASAYAASKAAVMGWTRQLAREVSPQGVRVNSIVPGAMRTRMAGETETAERRESYRRMHMIPRIGEADEVASAIRFAASSEASFMTGATLTVDGGCTAKGIL